MTMTIVSKLGVHSRGDRRTGLRGFYQAIYDAGRQVAGVKCRDNFGAAFEAREFWPDCFTVGALTRFDGFPFGENEWNDFLSVVNLNRHITAWEIFNEQNGDWQSQTDVYISLMPRFKANGIKLVMFNCASGTPDYPPNDQGAYAQIARACRYAIDNGYQNDVFLGLHEYGYGPDTIGRYAVLAEYLESVGALLPIIRTEYGPEEGGPQIAPDALVNWCAAHDPIGDNRIVFDALWTTGGGWADISPAFDELGVYVATVPSLAPPPVEMIHFAGRTHPQYITELNQYCNERGISIWFGDELGDKS